MIPCCASRHLGLFRASSCHLIQSGAGRKYHPAILVQAPIAVTHCNHSRTGLSPTLSLSLCIDSMHATSGEKSVHVIYVDDIKTSLKDGCFTSATPPGNPSISSKPRLYAAVSGDGGVRNTGHKTLRISQFHVGWIDTERERSTVTTRLGLHAQKRILNGSSRGEVIQQSLAVRSRRPKHFGEDSLADSVGATDTRLLRMVRSLGSV